METDENWAKSENPEVEAAKEAFAEAQVETLRSAITQYATNAVKHGVDRDWVNGKLTELGAKPVTGRSEYRMNVAVTGVYGWRCKASSRAEALERFNEQVNRVALAGKITADGSYDNVYDLAVTGEPTFYSGPEDPADSVEPVPGLDALKVGIRDMLKAAVAGKGWGYAWAQDALRTMGLPELPEMGYRTVQVPVSGMASVTVRAFEGDDVQDAARAALSGDGQVLVVPDEIGMAVEVS